MRKDKEETIRAMDVTVATIVVVDAVMVELKLLPTTKIRGTEIQIP